MKNLFAILVCCCLVGFSVSAQNTKVINGAVVDKNGNPLPGAIVEATGGAENTVVDADGSFSIEVPIWLKSLTARYSGMKTSKQNINGLDMMIFRLSPQSDGRWFVNLEGSIGVSPSSVYRVGIMAGYLGNWGGYAKILPTFCDSDAEGTPAATVGIIKRIKKPVYAYFGLGYAPICEEDYKYGNYLYPGGMVEAGFIFNIKRFNINVGYSFSFDFEDTDYSNNDIHFGLGYCF